MAATFLLATLSLLAGPNRPTAPPAPPAPPAEDIPRLRPPRAEVPPGPWEAHGVAIVAGAVGVVVVAGCGVWWLLRSKPPLVVPPAIQARQALEPLRQQPESGLVLSQISQILRRYVAAAFGLPPGELTTADFCRAMASQQQVGPEITGTVSDFLRRCDERKFAPLPPLPPLGAVAQATQIVEQVEARLAMKSGGRNPKPA